MQKKDVVAIAAPAPLDPADLLTPEELSVRLKVSPSWVYNALRQRGPHPLPHFKMGRYLRFSWHAVSAWLHSQRRGVA
jgi:excisionase family DNA binding protein